MTKELDSWIKSQIENGISKKKIKNKLIEAGHDKETIVQLLKKYKTKSKKKNYYLFVFNLSIFNYRI